MRLPFARRSPPAPRSGQALADWTDTELERRAGWHDKSGRSPVDLLSTYLRARHAWELRWRKTALRAGPVDPGWLRATEQLAAIHAELSTPRDPASRDSSLGDPASRDPNKTRIVTVRWPSTERIVIKTEEDDPLGLVSPDVYEVVVVMTDAGWRLDDRTYLARGRRISGVL
jgi:hypothetical protein